MTAVGVLAFISWFLSGTFLYLHGRTRWRLRPAGVAVFVMALVSFLVLTLTMVRVSFDLKVDDWLRSVVYGLVALAFGWMTVTILHYEYGDHGGSTATLNPGTRKSDREETR